MIKLVLSDIDNTLVPYGHSHASRRTIAAIHACQREGISFGPASGRNRTEVASFLDHDQAAYQTAVLVNGQEVWLEGERISQTTLDASDLAHVAQVVRHIPHCALLTFREDGFCDWCGDDPETLAPVFESAVLSGHARHQDAPSYQVVKAGIIAMVDLQDERALQERLTAECPHLDLHNTVSNWFDVVPRGLTKADGVEALQKALGITKDEICVFGDAENDLAMLDRVTHSVAVANADKEVAMHARWHVGASAEDGVAIALEQLADAARLSRELDREVFPTFMQRHTGQRA